MGLGTLQLKVIQPLLTLHGQETVPLVGLIGSMFKHTLQSETQMWYQFLYLTTIYFT